MYYVPNRYPYQHPYYVNEPVLFDERYSGYWPSDGADYVNSYGTNPSFNDYERVSLRDHGPKPFTVDINEASKQNKTFRTALWTGTHLQVTLMSINVGEDIGLEMHPNLDQFLRIEQGHGVVRMGKRRNQLNFVRNVKDDTAIIIPAGTWHNVINTANIPLKLYSIYAPPNHPFGTVHTTKAEAMAAESGHSHGRKYNGF
jgi:mannose-6-phosphate isomerase-like protein (cupin superfamily)